MERHAIREDEVLATKAEEPGRSRRWVRNALLAILPLFGGDNPQTQVALERVDTPTRVKVVQETLRIPGTFLDEQKGDPAFTEEDYLNLLARTLTTPEKLHAYVKTRLQYVQEERGQDHWQSPEETVRKGGGDCEDFAFLGQEILRRQGKIAHVISPPGHAVCVWMEKRRADENYDAYTLDEQGVDKNGQWERQIRSPHGSVPAEHPGFDTLIEGLNSALHKFHDADGGPFSVCPYWIPVLRKIGPFPYADAVTVSAFDPDAPLPLRISGLELVSLMALLGGSYGTYRLLRQRRGAMKDAWKEYFTTFRLH